MRETQSERYVEPRARTKPRSSALNATGPLPERDGADPPVREDGSEGEALSWEKDEGEEAGPPLSDLLQAYLERR